MDNNIPKISVVMSVYNGGEFLSQSIESILKQSFPDFEFIIIDDASTDNTWEILTAFSLQDKRIKLFRNEKNIGIEGFIKNLNTGCKNAKGKYIARMDHDDISNIDRLQLQFEFLENNPDIFILGSALQKIDKDGEKLGLMQAPLTDEQIREVMPKKISLYHPAIMFRNQFYENFYRQKMRYCEDYDFYLRIMTDSLKMSNLKESLLDYRVLDSSMSRKKDKTIKNLFIDQAKQFYKERLAKGTDSYDTFDPNEYLNLHNKPSKELLRKAIIVSKKYYDYDGFKKMMDNYIGKDFFYFRNKPLTLLGKAIFNRNAKLVNKLNS